MESQRWLGDESDMVLELRDSDNQLTAMVRGHQLKRLHFQTVKYIIASNEYDYWIVNVKNW